MVGGSNRPNISPGYFMLKNRSLIRKRCPKGYSHFAGDLKIKLFGYIFYNVIELCDCHLSRKELRVR